MKRARRRVRARARRRPAAHLIVSEASAAKYAVEQGFVASAAAVNGDVVVTSHAGYHNVFLLLNRAGDSFVFKQPADDPGALEREAAFYQFLWSSGLGRDIPIPEFFAHDHANSILVLRLVDNAIDLATHYRRAGRISMRSAADMGAALARLHHDEGARLLRVSGLSNPGCASPFAFFAMLSRIESLPTFSSAEIEIIKIIHADQRLSRELEQLASSWVSDTLIHADVRFRNFLFATCPGLRNRRRVSLIDWEHAGLGDAAWDVGCVLAAFLEWWVGSIPIVRDEKEFPDMQAARWPLSGMTPAVRAFADSYLAARNLSFLEAGGLIERAIRYACVRMLQHGLEQVQDSMVLTSAAVLMLQLAKNGMNNPLALRRQLLDGWMLDR